MVGRLALVREEVEEGLFHLVEVVEGEVVEEEEACWVTQALV